jgi:branched-subunit amino acid aminotransferase/4-amino-4-deoxychorismate lyase
MSLDASHTVLAWRDGELRPVDEAPAGALLAADSWLVDEGKVRGYERHWARFEGWCQGLLDDPTQLAAFHAAATAVLPRAGRWFPRVDLVGSAAGRAGRHEPPAPRPHARPRVLRAAARRRAPDALAASAQLLLRVRPARPLMLRARVRLAEPGDLRGHPRRKGPDLPLLLRLRAGANAAGADELVLRDSHGRLLEGALSSLLWWEDEALCAAPDERTLPSITRALLFDIARERGIEVRRRAPWPDELAGCEAWLANAAHGICVVSAWDPDGPQAGPPERAEGWRAALDATARHLDA